MDTPFSCGCLRPTPIKCGTLYILLLAQVTVTTDPDSKVVTPERGRRGGGGAAAGGY